MIYQTSPRVLIITGEISGDIYGYLLIKRIKDLNSAFQFVGIGGPKMRSLGIEILFPAESLALVGLPSFSELKKYWFVYKKIEEFLRKRRVDVIILVDFPGFNLKIAKLAKKLGYPVIYYIAPQAWAWNKKRVHILRKYVDRLYVLLPFEKEFFSSYGISTVYLGHPILDLIKTNLSERFFYEIYQFNKSKPLVSFFPGSREREISRHIPMFLKIFENLKKINPHIQGIMVKAPGLKDSFLWDKARSQIKVIENTQYEVLKYSTVALLASGTITLEAALLETPAIVTYSLPSWMYFIAKKLIKVPYISLANLILQKEIYPEVIKEKDKIGVITHKIKELIENEKARTEIKKELSTIKKLIGSPGASWRIAEDMIKYILSLKRG
ncbi:lipid-A-disaccharide synthase [Thermodesulfobacterium geofontis OPF15]|jgi:lipid-A-disaccharide synthase|uniref:Lipid-A-disaccharide synthase n=2 Tax=Thermodesulfobacterium geofontis TaxID=1295609 RepID=F8C1S5_THEGP|nr:lipid-A-disaccharide synthase [Thermodesulfobacterium geofontis]AEH22144.1 lipid-A-disaccharide synthase [Thermodesulfobacterium geofontis OPF15]